jgi:pyridoxal phosphate enzyme (YggS family)
MTRAEAIAHNLAEVRERVRRAERAAGRAEGSVRLVAVSKTMPAEDVAAAMAAGQRDFGENYAQELRDKRAQVATLAGEPAWHFIGPLQSNKVKYLAGKVALLHTLDTAELLQECERRAAAANATQDCLVQVNVAGEAQKRGLTPGDLPGLLDRFAGLPHLRCVGLMLIPPLVDDPEAGRPHFAALRRLRDQEAARARPRVALEQLSMGMSHDFEVAVAEGATLVRVGTAIFGARGG